MKNKSSDQLGDDTNKESSCSDIKFNDNDAPDIDLSNSCQINDSEQESIADVVDLGIEKLKNTQEDKCSEVIKNNSHPSLEETTSKNETSSHSLDNTT